MTALMTELLAFPITRKRPPQLADRLQLYSVPTPKGVKATIMLEETGLPYEPHPVRSNAQDQLSPEFLSLNPNSKIPAILDPQGPNGAPLAVFESGDLVGISDFPHVTRTLDRFPARPAVARGLAIPKSG